MNTNPSKADKMNEIKCPYCGGSPRVIQGELRIQQGDKYKSKTEDTSYLKKKKEDVIKSHTDIEIRFCCKKTEQEYTK